MSYDLSLVDSITKNTLEVDEKHHIKGGTYEVGGSNKLHINITYNYAEHFEKAFNNKEGIRSIYGKSGAESIPFIKEAISKLGDDVTDNYWDSTEGNTKEALLNILLLAKMAPNGEWSGD